jgi:hypothetical protein
MHRHAKTCKKKGNKICRFNFPLPPMPRTMILQPLDDSFGENQIWKVIKEHSDKIKELLDGMKCGEDITFENLLEKNRINRRRVHHGY